jgi:hypothetical protein
MPRFENMINIFKKGNYGTHIHRVNIQNFNQNWNQNSTTVIPRFWQLIGAPESIAKNATVTEKLLRTQKTNFMG